MKNRATAWQASQSKRKEKLAAIIQKLENGVNELFTSENYRDYLRTMSQFRQYSFNNTLLIALQKPDATLVASYTAWKQKFHRQVRKGERGITIIAPVPVKEGKEKNTAIQPDPAGNDSKEQSKMYFRAVTVFDISSTDGEPLPTIDVKELTGKAEGYSAFMQALRTISSVPVRFDTIEGGAKGYYHHQNKEIVIQSGMSERQTMKTGAHELAHALIHDRDYMKSEGIKKNRQLIEQEAESVAFCVCSYFGLDDDGDVGKDYSFPYIAGWAQSADMTELRASMDLIRKTAGSIIDGIETEMAKQLEVQKETKEWLEPERPSLLEELKKEKKKQMEKKMLPAGEKEAMIADRHFSRGKEMVL